MSNAIKGSSRALWLGVIAGVLSITGIALVVAASVPSGETLPAGSRATPHSLIVYSSASLPPEVKAQETASAPSLFDRDTTTEHVAYADSQVQASFKTEQSVGAIKVFGPAPYLLTVKAEAGGSYQTIGGLENVNLAQLASGWHTFSAQTPVTTQNVMFVLTPQSGGSATGLRELEVWTSIAPVNVKSGIALLEKMLSPTPVPQGQMYMALNATANPTEGVIAVSNDNTADNSFSFTLDRKPEHFVRAYLTYELYGQGHWVSTRRKINSNFTTLAGGSPLLPTTTWSTQVERINPLWLKEGTNTIEFSLLLSSYKEAGYSVRNVRLVGELDTGANHVEKITPNEPDSSGTNPIEALTDGDLNTGWKPYPLDQPISAASPSVEFELRRPTQMDAVSFYLSAPLSGELTLSVKRAGLWSNYTTESAASLSSGWNTIYIDTALALDQRLMEAVKLTFTGGGASHTEIREFLFIGSATGAHQAPPRLIIAYPDQGQFYGRKAYIRGFVEPANNGSGKAAIYVGGQSQITGAGDIDAIIGKDSVGLATQADSDPWSVEVKAVYPNGEIIKTTVSLTEQRSAATPATGTLAGMLSGSVSPKGKKTLTHDESKLVFEAGTVATDTTITITPLAEEALPALDLGMTNVTKGPRRGYRFLPHGAKFQKNVNLTLPYDKALIPPGHTEDDIKTFYFDEAAGRWVELPRVAVDKTNKAINSTTDHFTDMINAVVTVPDHPNTVSFNPTSMKDIKAADPGAQVNLIEPPRANNTGDARLSYPIEVPPGRQGMQPQLAVSYNSSGGNGWMGLGWDLTVPSITIDTRFGVPRYDANLETETYMLNGEMLTPVAHRGELVTRTSPKTFHTRVEGQFQRIIRYGDHPGNYTWEVTDKSGARYFYGAVAGAGAPETNATLSDDSGNVFVWALRETRDTSANFMRYHYVRVNDTGIAGGSVPGVNLYVQRITYTGSGATEGKYNVTFIRDRELDEQLRADKQIDARGGFKRVTADRLRKIDVSFGNQLIRRYEFQYAEGAFKKTLLQRVVQFGKDGTTEFNRHTFAYYDEARDAAGNYRGFASSTDWGVGSDNVSAGLLGKGLASALGGTKSTSAGGHIYIGIGPAGDTSSKQATGGVKLGYSRSKSEGLLTMSDMNGDGLPDKVFKGGSGFYYRPNLSGPQGGTSFGDPVQLPGLSAISRESTTTTTVGGELYFGLAVMLDTNKATTNADTYFSDVNGDGLTDLVSGGQVLFGYINAQGVPAFSADSTLTPVPIGTGLLDTNGLLEDPAAQEAEYAESFPLLDTVRRWVAPYDGVVSINAPVRLIQDTSEERAQYTGADGVRVAIQLEGSELWSAAIGATDYDLHAPTGVDAIPVKRGDRIYFRVQSVFDGAYDQVAWDPAITYVGAPNVTDVNNLNPYRYQASQDFVLAGRRGNITAPLTGTLHLSGRFEKTAATTDNVTLLITRNGSDVYRRTFAYGETAVVDLSQDVAVTQLDKLEWRVLVDSPIDATRIKFSPSAYYTAAEGVDDVQDDQGNYVIAVYPPYDIDLYPADDLTAPQGYWSAPSTATVTVVPELNFTFPAGTYPSARVVFTVKKRGALLAKREIQITNGAVPSPASLAFDLDVTQGDELFFDFSALDATIAASLTAQSVQVNGAPVPSAFHSAMLDNAFPQPYRGWGVVGYNGNGARATQPVNQSLLAVTDSYDPNNARVYPFVPLAQSSKWGGSDENAWATGATLSSSRLGLDDIRMPRSGDFAGASAPARLSRSTNNSVSIGVGASEGNSRSQVDFQDMNGDRFPDVIGQGVQYTRAVGGLEGASRSVGLGSARSSENETFYTSTQGAGNIAAAIASARGTVTPDTQKSAQTGKQGSDMPQLGFGGDVSSGTTDTEYDLLDVNGDGLPDKVSRDGGVALNLGYRFADAEQWNGGEFSHGETLNAGVNMGYNSNAYSIAGGLNLGIGTSRSDEGYVDINGDGLPDKVTGGSVRLNTGNGFTGSIAWPGGHDKVAVDKHVSLGGGVYFTFGWNFFAVRVVINPGVNFSTSMGRPEYAFRDMDGDGFADHVRTEKDSELKVALNPIGRTNLLKKVHRPLGATFEMEYTRDGNTYDLPQSRWLMTKVKVFDGHVGQGADTQLISYSYTGPKYNRLEREFYGYATVVEKHHDTERSNTVYRSITRQYRTDSFYTKGLQTRELLQNEAGSPFTETENTYVVRDEQTGQALLDLQSTTVTGFPQLTRTDKRFYEGNLSPGKTTYTTHEYDSFGNVSRFFDAGDVGASDDVEAAIVHTNCQPAYIIQPNRITVKGNGVEMRRRESTIDCASGDVTEVRQYLASGSYAATNLTYESNGNLKTITGPVNKTGQRYTLTYEYDPEVATHVTRITDSHSLSSSATHNLLFGKVDTTTDTNGHQTTYLYDGFGRTEQVFGPYELGQSVATLAFSYAPVETPASDAAGNTVALPSVPWALTKHVDKDEKDAYKSSGTIDTILFVDGLKRIIQTKKDATVLEEGTEAAVDKMTVSGQITFDAFGRTVAQRYPTTEPKGGSNTVFNAAFDSTPPTTMEYDVLDRNTRSTLPDGSFTTVAYRFGADRAGTSQFETLVTDANVNSGLKGTVKSTFRDVRDLITSVKEYVTEGGSLKTVWTSYSYDALKQIVEVKDDKDNLTKATYDNLGRRTVLDNPDTGRQETVYDLASNVSQRITANLGPAKPIEYLYDFNRLKEIRYPVNAGNNISYTYGAATLAGDANGNRAGRITRITSQMGVEERTYGRLGEVVFEKKTITTFTNPLHPSVFETKYKYDTFGRLQLLTYPDGEVLTNTYDSGGNLRSAKGTKGSPSSGGTYHYVYLKDLFYDKFEQRALLVQGNSVKTAYTYDARTRRLTNLTAGKGQGNLFQNLNYTFDKVGNITDIENNVAVPPPNTYGGPTKQHFDYDEMYRLNAAWGTFQYSPQKTHRYDLAMVYDTIHNVTKKTQTHTLTQPSGVPITQKKTTYDWIYQYSASGTTSVRPHAPVHIGERAYTYDANGNQTGWTHDQNGTRRTIVWDEENRVQSLFDNGHEKTYKYDDAGDRVIKRGPQGETVYVNQFFTQRPGATGTKHFYAGTSRIVSKLMKQETPNSNGNGHTPYEKDLYFYHPDHLGTSSYITDTNGKLYEHLQYFPFGEAWVEENSNSQRTPYHFTSKELDEETGLYYFGARYYDPRTSLWQSADPILAKYLPSGNKKDRDKNLAGMGGVYNSLNLGLYTYGHQNPIKFIDPDGNETWFIGGAGVNGTYINDMTNKLSAAGIANVRAATPGMASFGNSVFDAALVTKWNQNLGGNFYGRYQGRVNLNLPKGEQLNLIGYSHGAIVASQTALAIAAGGQRVDNVVLVGAPINQDLLDALRSNKNIGNVHVINLTDKGDPIYAGMPDKEIVKSLPTLIDQQSKGTGHFYYAPDTKEGEARRGGLAQQIKEMGLQ